MIPHRNGVTERSTFVDQRACSPLRLLYDCKSQLLEIFQQLTCVQWFVAQIVVEQVTHQGFALLTRQGSRIISLFHIQKCLSTQLEI